MQSVDEALHTLGMTAADDVLHDPAHDCRLQRLFGLIDSALRRDREWLNDDRLIVFTEYKTTLDYLERKN
jgi:hypothetical protein